MSALSSVRARAAVVFSSTVRCFSTVNADRISSTATINRHRSDKSRYRYVKDEESATWQATQRGGKPLNAQAEAAAQPSAAPKAATPIDAAIAAEAAAALANARSSHSTSTALSIPEGSEAYSGRSSSISGVLPDYLFRPRPIGTEAKAAKTNIAISPQKLNDICRTVRGLSVREAMVQLKLSHKKKAIIVRSIVASAASNAVNSLDMNKDRLYVDRLWVGNGSHLKRLDIKGRGRSALKRKYRSHLYCIVKEQQDSEEYRGIWKYGGNSHDPRTGNEIRIGRVGRKLSSIERTLEQMKEWRTARGMDATPSPRDTRSRVRLTDAKKAFATAGVATDHEAIFGKAAVEAAAAAAAAATKTQSANQ